jgi:hypothetical protein
MRALQPDTALKSGPRSHPHPLGSMSHVAQQSRTLIDRRHDEVEGWCKPRLALLHVGSMTTETAAEARVGADASQPRPQVMAHAMARLGATASATVHPGSDPGGTGGVHDLDSLSRARDWAELYGPLPTQ